MELKDSTGCGGWKQGAGGGKIELVRLSEEAAISNLKFEISDLNCRR
jgi:hypothetical protein